LRSRSTAAHRGSSKAVVNQLIGVAIVITYDAIVSLLILKLIDSRLGLRVSSDVEMEGLDLTLHGEAVQ
jgi:ammonium transporter, Amt family